MDEIPKPVSKTYTLEDTDWQNAFGERDDRPPHLLLQDALSELDRPQSPAYHSMKQGFAEIDLDGDGFLNSSEIAFFARKDGDLAELAGDQKAQWEIKRLNDDGKYDSKGISQKDLLAFGQLDVSMNHARNDPKELKLAAEFLDKYFQKLDRKRDGFISKEELAELSTDPNLKFSYRQRFLLVDRHFEKISEQYKDKILKVKEHAGLSQSDLRTLISNQGRFIRR